MDTKGCKEKVVVVVGTGMSGFRQVWMSISCISSSPTPPPLENKQTKQKEKSVQKCLPPFAHTYCCPTPWQKDPTKRPNCEGKG